jgi:hypothetical protein
MTYALVPEENVAGATQETSEYRRTHFRVYDENGFTTAFAITPPENATLASVSASLCALFQGTGGTGYDSKDLVVLLGARIVAVVLKGRDGEAHVTTFQDGTYTLDDRRARG